MNQNQEKISLRSLIDLIPARRGGIDCSGLNGSEQAYLICRLRRELKVPLIIIVSSHKDAEIFLQDLHFFLNSLDIPILYFPPYNILPHKFLAYHSETAAARIRTLYHMIESPAAPIVLTTVGALLQRLIPKEELGNYAELIMEGEEIDHDLLIKKLISGGYQRTTIVEEPGDFSIRGGILDVFSPLYEDPLRIELFGDTVDSLRFFSASSQRTMKRIQEAIILPAKEVILKKERLPEIVNRVRKQASIPDIPVTKVRELIDRIKKEGVFPGLESLISLIYPKLDTFFDYTPANSLFISIEPEKLEKIAEELQTQAQANFAASSNEDRLCADPDTLYLKWSDAQKTLAEKKPLTIRMLSLMKGGDTENQSFSHYYFSVENNTVVSHELKNYQEKENLFLPLANWIDAQKRGGFRTMLVCNTDSQAERLRSLLIPYGVQFKLINEFPDFKSSIGLIYGYIGQISSGFVWPDESLAIITEDEIFGIKHHRRKISRPKVQTELLDFEDLKKGDLVVHDEHGIGQYEGLVKLKLNDVTNDFLLIQYKDQDKLYLPVERMSKVQKYMGVDGIEPVLDKMGGKSWDRVKKRVKKSVEKIAGELLKLYAARKIGKGHAFGDINSYFRDFEAGFPYEETADQLNAIQDVLHDMAQPLPMDRLICGDVGYGKTEVALRASFVAVNDGKQVAVLVPTTVLAEQHFATFSERFERYPIRIECLSRFRSAKQQREIVNDLKTGKIDIVIGTHRLLQKDIAFKDLGLVVLDEEQRFGVKHKENLKKMRKSVDVLALTATPIPRTLHLSLMGIRDISIISTPPEQRHAIITYISEFDDTVIAEAVRKELHRGGQIFFVHNNIKSIWRIAEHLQQLVPEVRLDVAHGQLDENELERVMLRFMNKEIDLLVCTTIIESGLDIPAANTILVNRADRFGLAQIYQLRGRVGRADEQAYAYLFIPRNTLLGKEAQKRLKVLMEHSDLGSGFQIAMSDLKIRGGGTMLGVSQSGHIAAVGYDMFLKLMEDAVAELKGEPLQERLEPEINISISAFIPESYIADIDQRMTAYRRLVKMTELKEIAEFKAELIDRFGPLPMEAANLLLKIMLKVLSVKAGVKRLDLTGQQLLFYFSEAHQKYPYGIVDMITAKQECFEFTPEHVLKVRLSKQSPAALLAETKNILKEISQHVNG
ncbi:MAG: transcription-repair coupling factor [Desulfobacterales bacterium]|nr:transcription-repair coupling factor [Desulfobacterales bacterium]